MTSIVVVTTAERGTVDAAHALLESVRSNWPEATLKVLCTDDVMPPPASWDVASVTEVHATRYNVGRILRETEQLALALPFYLRQLLEQFDICLYLGSGMLLVRPPEELVREAEKGGMAVVVPATVTPAFSLTPTLGPLDAGAYLPDSRCLALTHSGLGFLEDWSDTVRQAVLDADQRSVHWAGHTFLQRSIARNDVEVEGKATLMHWPDYASVEAERALGPSASIIECDGLFATVRAQNYDDPEVAWSLLVHRVHDSRPLEPFIRLIREGQQLRSIYDPETPYEVLRAATWRSADPFGRHWGPDSESEFEDWLFAENEAGCTRIADILVKLDWHLSRRFPRARLDPEPLAAWVDERGRVELGFDPFDRDYEPRESEVVGEEERSGIVNAIAWRFNVLKTLVPGHDRRTERTETQEYLGPDPAQTRGTQPPRAIDVVRTTPMWGTSPRGLNILGPFRSESGLGQASRATLSAVRLLGTPFTHIDTTEKYPSRNSVDVGLTHETYGQFGEVNLIHSNADEMLTMAQGIFKYRFGGRFNAAMWFWEPADLPMHSRPAFHIVDELWVASEYERSVFGQYAQVPVHVIGLAADLPEERHPDRKELGWSPDEFVFLFVYDALSSYGRKNPKLALQAFVEAFAPRFDGVRFVLKVSNLNKFPASQRELLGLADKYPAITVIDEYLPREGVLDLMSAADVYVSLHAAEGFGLTLLEAMALGTPVICTGYSGNMDFTNDENSWLVDYSIIRTDEQTGPYPAGAVWAKPRREAAVEAMRQARADRSEVAEKGGLARHDALEAASLEMYARRLQERLSNVL